MKNVVWVLNKYNLQNLEERSFIDFLRYLKEISLAENINLILIRFSEQNFSEDFVSPQFSGININDFEIERLEKEYGVTIKSLLYPDLVQLNTKPFVIEVSSKRHEEIESKAVAKFIWLEEFFKKNKIDLLFADQSPEYEMVFANHLAHKHHIPSFRVMEGAFFGRSVIVQNSINLNRSLSLVDLPLINEENFQDELERILNYETRKVQPYKKNNFFEAHGLRGLLRSVKKRFMFSFKKPLYADLPSKYFFFSPHLLQESTLHFRAMHFSNQTSLIEMIARVLPHDTHLVVREHPHWPERYPRTLLKQWSSIKNVKVLSPNLDIHKILSGCRGVITINSTTGLEACAYNKPVITFVPTIYEDLPNVYRIKELHDLPFKIQHEGRLTEGQWERYVNQMMVRSFPFTLNSFSFNDSNYVYRAKCISSIMSHLTKNNEIS